MPSKVGARWIRAFPAILLLLGPPSILVVVAVVAEAAWAGDLGYRYSFLRGQCVLRVGRDFVAGFNPGYDGECGMHVRESHEGESFRYRALRGANFRFGDLDHADFSRADLRGAILSGAQARFTSFARAHLQGASLRESRFWSPDFSGANLSEAHLTDAWLNFADLRGADLGGAYLTGAHLRSADLRGADLTGATLRGTELEGCAFDSSTLLPFSREEALGRGMVDLGAPQRDLGGYPQAPPDTPPPGTVPILPEPFRPAVRADF